MRRGLTLFLHLGMYSTGRNKNANRGNLPLSFFCGLCYNSLKRLKMERRTRKKGSILVICCPECDFSACLGRRASRWALSLSEEKTGFHRMKHIAGV